MVQDQNHTTTTTQFLTKMPKIHTGEKQHLQQMVLGKLDIYM